MNLNNHRSLGLFALLALAAPILLQGNQYYLHVYILCIINVILASSLRPIALTGQMSIGQAGFMAVGAYTSAILATKFNLPVPVSILLGGVLSMVLAGLIGFPLSRLKTIYFVMVTMFLGEIIRLVIFEWSDMTGGSTGMTGIASWGAVTIPGLGEIDFSHRLAFSYLAACIMIACLLFLYSLERSQRGLVLRALGQDESLLSSVGGNVAWNRVMIFALGSFFTGLAGGLYAHYAMVLNPDSFGIFTSLYIMIYVVVGGNTFIGPIVGALVLTLIPELFGALKEYQPFVFVSVLFCVIFFLPRGLVSLPSLVLPGRK
jgi:branched-chain amino acid transport system permease protein